MIYPPINDVVMKIINTDLSIYGFNMFPVYVSKPIMMSKAKAKKRVKFQKQSRKQNR